MSVVTRPLRRSTVLLGAVSLLGMAAVVAAESTPTPAPPTPTTVPLAEVPRDLRSPRATMETFLTAFYADGAPDFERATSCLDLRDMPATVRTLKGRELVVKLKNALDRTRYVEIDRVPADPEGEPWTFQRYAAGPVEIVRVADGRWLFSARTVAAVDEIHDEIADRQMVEGVQGAPEVVTPAMWIRGLVPETLRTRVFLLEGWQWILLMAVLFAGFVAGRAFGFAATLSLDRFLRRQFTRVDAGLLAKAIHPASVFVMVVLWGIGVAWMGLPVTVLRIYLDAIKVAGVVAFVVTAYRLVDVGAAVLEIRAKATASRFDDLLVPLLRKSVKVFVVAVGVVMVAQNLGTDVTSLVAGLGLGGLAFALAARDTVGNLFGSVTVLVDRPFQVGDWVKIGDVEGMVEELGFRSTRIRTFYNSLITLPNSNLITSAVDNLGARTYRRWSTRLGVTYDTPPEAIDAFCEGIREVVRTHPYTRKDYYHVYFNEFGADCLEILLYVFFQTPDWPTELRERHRLGVDIVRLAHRLGVEFAFPTQTLYLRRESWTAPELAGERYPEASASASVDARRAAREMVEATVGSTVPPPVTFGGQPPPDGGDEPV